MVETGQAGLLKITREAPAESVLKTPVGRDGAVVKGTMSERKISGFIPVILIAIRLLGWYRGYNPVPFWGRDFYIIQEVCVHGLW